MGEHNSLRLDITSISNMRSSSSDKSSTESSDNNDACRCLQSLEGFFTFALLDGAFTGHHHLLLCNLSIFNVRESVMVSVPWDINFDESLSSFGVFIDKGDRLGNTEEK